MQKKKRMAKMPAKKADKAMPKMPAKSNMKKSLYGLRK